MVRPEQEFSAGEFYGTDPHADSVLPAAFPQAVSSAVAGTYRDRRLVWVGQTGGFLCALPFPRGSLFGVGLQDP
jgi:hypothetical protein